MFGIPYVYTQSRILKVETTDLISFNDPRFIRGTLAVPPK